MPTLKDVADFFGLTSERQMAAKLNVAAPISTLALIKAFEKIPPVANFKVDVTDGHIPFKVQFTDESRGYITSRAWDFDDGKTSTDASPLHTYDTTNCVAFSPKLTIKNPFNQDSHTMKFGIISRPQPPKVKIGASPTSGPAPLKVQFSDETGEVFCATGRTWTFPNGATSSDANLVFTFENHTTQVTPAQVTLAVGNSGGVSETWVTIQVAPQPSSSSSGGGSGSGQGPAPYVYMTLDPSTQTVTVHGAHFQNGASILVNLFDTKGMNETVPVPGVVSGGEFNAPIGVEGCSGGNMNTLNARATWDNGAHWSNTAQLTC